MNLAPLDVPGLLRQYGLRPDKKFGQNFLVDPVALDRVVAAAGELSGAAVLEVGPGLGSLTRLLAERARRVIAVELDSRLIPPLTTVLMGHENITIVEGDILQLDPGDLVGHSGYRVVANIPYYITSALLRHLLEAEARPNRMVLTVQREVAARICATPGEMSLLALSVQVYGQPQIVARIPAGAFFPVPKVDSAVVRVDFYPQPRIPAPLLGTFFQLARSGFSQKRKTMRNSLAAGLGWPAEQTGELLKLAGVDPGRRAETLSIEEWGQLVNVYLEGNTQDSDMP